MAVNSFKQALYFSAATAKDHDVAGKGEVGHMDVGLVDAASRILPCFFKQKVTNLHIIRLTEMLSGYSVIAYRSSRFPKMCLFVPGVMAGRPIKDRPADKEGVFITAWKYTSLLSARFHVFAFDSLRNQTAVNTS